MKIMAIKDKAVESYGMPLVTRTVTEAIRIFKNEVNREDSMMNKYPQDYDLYQIGEYDDLDGKVQSTTPTQVATGIEVKDNPIE